MQKQYDPNNELKALLQNIIELHNSKFLFDFEKLLKEQVRKFNPIDFQKTKAQLFNFAPPQITNEHDFIDSQIKILLQIQKYDCLFLCKDLISDDSPIAKEINFDLISENELREIIKNIEAAGTVKINHKILWRVLTSFMREAYLKAIFPGFYGNAKNQLQKMSKRALNSRGLTTRKSLIFKDNQFKNELSKLGTGIFKLDISVYKQILPQISDAKHNFYLIHDKKNWVTPIIIDSDASKKYIIYEELLKLIKLISPKYIIADTDRSYTPDSDTVYRHQYLIKRIKDFDPHSLLFKQS